MARALRCAPIALDRGELEAATAGFERAQKIAKEIADPMEGPNVDVSLAEIDMGHGRWMAARDRLQRAVDGFAKCEMTSGEAVARQWRKA